MKHVIAFVLLSGWLWSQSSFVCPDSKAKQACSSFLEDKDRTKLLKTKTTLVCFREEKDEYFVIDPKLSDYWQWEDKSYTLTTSIAIPQIETIDHGVSNPELMPSLEGIGLGVGSWHALATGAGVFFMPAGDATKDDDLKSFVFNIDKDSLDLTIPYQNRDKQTVTYNLSITLSTHRFREGWRGPIGLPQDDYGRCSGMITLPSQQKLKAAMPVQHP